jgi:hypothetical protein
VTARALPIRSVTTAAYIIFAALSAFLLFYNLDGRLLWGDEAETAVLAKNTVHFGVPKTFDGRNRITLYGAGIDGNEDDLWVLSPWLQEYAAAASFKLFGFNTAAARAPFALIAWLSLILLGRVAHRIYRDHRVTLTTLLLVGTSEIFLLHARQCRYYSIAVLAQTLVAYGIYELLIHSRTAPFILTIALILQFYSNYIIALANVPLLFLVGAMLFRESPKYSLPLVSSLIATAFAAAPWILYARVWRQSAGVGHESWLSKLLVYTGEFNFHFLPLSFLLLPLIGWFALKLRRQRASAAGASPESPLIENKFQTQPTLAAFEGFLLLLLPLYVAVIALAPGVYLRYLLPVLPIACLLAAAWLFRYVRRPSIIIPLLVLQCAANIIALGTLYPLRGKHSLTLTFPRFVATLNQLYPERLQDVLIFLKKESKPNQTIFTFDPEFPLQFYTDLKIIDARLSGGALSEPWPDWILPESATALVARPRLLPKPLIPLYESITIPVHASLRYGDIPEPDLYEYRSPTNMSPFVLYKRRPTQAD